MIEFIILKTHGVANLGEFKWINMSQSHDYNIVFDEQDKINITIEELKEPKVVSKYFGYKKVKSINGIIGENGSGKSTLIGLIINALNGSEQNKEVAVGIKKNDDLIIYVYNLELDIENKNSGYKNIEIEPYKGTKNIFDSTKFAVVYHTAIMNDGIFNPYGSTVMDLTADLFMVHKNSVEYEEKVDLLYTKMLDYLLGETLTDDLIKIPFFVSEINESQIEESIEDVFGEKKRDFGESGLKIKYVFEYLIMIYLLEPLEELSLVESGKNKIIKFLCDNTALKFSDRLDALNKLKLEVSTKTSREKGKSEFEQYIRRLNRLIDQFESGYINFEDKDIVITYIDKVTRLKEHFMSIVDQHKEELVQNRIWANVNDNDFGFDNQAYSLYDTAERLIGDIEESCNSIVKLVEELDKLDDDDVTEFISVILDEFNSSKSIISFLEETIVAEMLVETIDYDKFSDIIAKCKDEWNNLQKIDQILEVNRISNCETQFLIKNTDENHEILQNIYFKQKNLTIPYNKIEIPKGLSSGEFYELQFKSSLYSIKESLEGKNVLFIFDESEVYLHPKAQNRYIKGILDFLEKFVNLNQIQIMISTNSPFLVSDLQNSSLTFLTNGNQIQGNYTFGANIYKILDNEFFMDYTIGALAVKIIEQITQELKGDDVNIEKLKLYELIANTIGEPLIQRNLIGLVEQRKKDINDIKDIDERNFVDIDTLPKELRDAIIKHQGDLTNE